jgi:disulfide bond formation protein DsbB
MQIPNVTCNLTTTINTTTHVNCVLAQYKKRLKYHFGKEYGNVAVVAWYMYIVVIASASRTDDPGFESRQGVRFLGLNTLQCCCQNFICIVVVCLRKINASKTNK